MKQARGFTLIELAIVLVLITILIGGLVVPLSAQIQARRIAETNRTLEEAREAIIGYAMSHTIASSCICAYSIDEDTSVYRREPPPASTCPLSLCPSTALSAAPLTLPITRHFLPCPDARTDSEPGVDNDGDGNLSDINNGHEDRKADGTCLQDTGNFPWVTLGTAAQDAWGNRLRYATHADLTNKTSGFHSDSKPTPGDSWNRVCSTNGCAVVVADDLPVVLLSHGANGWGALNVNGNTLAPPTSADEGGNVDADRRYVSRPPSRQGDAAGEFDDITTWLSFKVLLSRVCPAGGCP